MLKILWHKNQGIHWYPWHPTFLWKINFTLVRRLISALIWDISGLRNRSDGQDFREKLIDISRFLALYLIHSSTRSGLFTIWYVMRNTGFNFRDISHVKVGVIAHQKIEAQPILYRGKFCLNYKPRAVWIAPIFVCILFLGKGRTN